jgi:hypothetical protein
MTTPSPTSPFVVDQPLLPCGHPAKYMIVRNGVRLGCLLCQTEMSLGLILHLENMTRLEKLEREA